MQATGPIIRTKLHLPFTRPGLVSRPRLQEQIVQGLGGPLTLITAPAGFGKTTLAASCVASSGMPVAWLSLDKNDNQTGRFLIYLVAALQEADPAIGSEAAQLAAAVPQVRPEAVLTTLINDLDMAGRQIALVLDDYQYISSQAVHEEVAFLLEHCPHTFHLVIATRSDPPLPLARLRARGQTIEMRAADLRFTGTEAAQFLNGVMGLHLDGGAVAALEERTEGWIAGLQMAALSMKDRKDISGFIQGFSGTNRYILDYLLEEVLSNQPVEIQHFLLNTSILERLAAPLCDAILLVAEPLKTGDPGGSQPVTIPVDSSASILEYLERENIFLIGLDDERTWFRYHHLFANLLNARLQQAQPGSIPRLHGRASEWFEKNGFYTEAIQHALAAQEVDRAASLIDRYGPARWSASDPSVLQMAENLPAEMLVTWPKIGLYLAWSLIIQSRISNALPLLNDLARKFAEVEPGSGQQWVKTIVRLAIAFLSPMASAGFEPLPDYQTLDAIPAEEIILRNAADFLYGMTLARRGEMGRAVEISISCIQRERASSKTQAIPTLAPFLSRIYVMQGRLDDAASLCRECLDPIEGKDFRFIYTAGSMKIDLGEVLSERNFLEEAEQNIRDGLKANEAWRNIMTDGFGLTALVRLLLAKKDYSGAMGAVEKLEKRLHEHAQPREFDEDLRTLRVRMQLARGDLQSATQWADQVLLSHDYELHQEYYRLTLARIRLGQGRFADVEALLTGKALLVGTGSQISRQIESNSLLAAAQAGQERVAEALEMIDGCLVLAEPEGYIRVFLDVGEPARELLAVYRRANTGCHQAYARKILNAFSAPGETGPSGPQPAGLVEPLSGRELEVLQLMALGKTNQEIAIQLIVSPGTVKAHTSSIYRKLDVANRTEAVGRARQLNIIS